MGISKKGLHGEITGKVGKLVYYERLGKQIVRSIGENLNPPSEAQLHCRQQLSVASKFCSAMIPFLNVSYKMHTIGTDKSAYNLAMQYNKKHAVAGVYPDVHLVYSEILISEGDLKPADHPVVVPSAEGLVFSWNTDPQMPWPDYTDQVMMAAYFPRLGRCEYVLFGAARQQGTDTLLLNAELQNEYKETYISFISADRRQVATSKYTGSF